MATSRADDAPADDSDVAYYVVGISPDTAAPVFHRGDIEDGRFSSDFSWGNDHSAPVEGFVLEKTKKDRLIGITGVGFETPTVLVGRTGLNGLLMRPLLHAVGAKDYLPFSPCGDIPTLTFMPQRGHVLYIASVAYSFREGEDFQGHGDRLQTTMSNDIEGARAFLAKNYPQLAPRLEQGTYQMVPTKISCPL